jgi:acetoacetate decarboxylase
MSKKGKLKAANYGFDIPVDAPLYPNPPYHYKDVEAFVITYETDEAAALALLPDKLELTSPAMALLLFLKYPFSALGPYEETVLAIHCTYQGNPRIYIPHIVLNNDVPLAAGREVYGFPKKLAEVIIKNQGDGIWARMERPKGNPICSAGIRLEERVVVSDEPMETYSMSLRVIPSPTKDEKPTVSELIETHNTNMVKDFWTGTGWIDFHSQSAVDPWHKLSVKRIISSTYSLYDYVLGFGKAV